MTTILFGVLIAAITIEIFLIFTYNKPNIEVKLDVNNDFDVYTVYLNYIKYIDYLEYSEKENRTKKLFTFKRKHKEQ